MDDSLDFTDDEIRDELSKLGYSNVPDGKLEEFKKGMGTYTGKVPSTMNLLAFIMVIFLTIEDPHYNDGFCSIRPGGKKN